MITKVTGSGERIATYEIDDTEVAAGSTLGSPKGVIILKANGAIDKFYSTDAGYTLISGMQVRYWSNRTGVALSALPGKFIIHPDRQDHVFELSNGLMIRESIFMLGGTPQRTHCDPAIAYYHIELQNTSNHPIDVISIAAANLRGNVPGDDISVRYEEAQRAFFAVNRDYPDHGRAFWVSRRPSSWEVTSDHGKCSRIVSPGKLSNSISRTEHERIALFEHRYRIAPDASTSVTFRLIASSTGRRELRKNVALDLSARDAQSRTSQRFKSICDRAIVMTPDSEVNRGVLWAKANMLRTELLAPTGWCFVNDPTRSNNSVARDTAWFAFGSDYVTPDFSRESLKSYVRHLEKSGMAIEYYDIRTGASADYKLNINDDTPLLILALWHHYNATGDEAFLDEVYRAARRAGNYILSQRNKQGLVWCTSRGTSDWGIVGWRNVIKGYRISGASTELNSECYAALGAVSKMASRLGKASEADRFAREAQALKGAINEHLLDPETGLYYLTIDVDGSKRSNVTCDLVFPVMFGVADRERAAHIVSRLSVDTFWTQAGIRTVPRDDINYGPTHGYGLLGGVWVGVTFWYAFAAARFNPGFMASALRESFRHYSRDPRRNNTVPGQFSEWLHGETLVNQGMMLSPWFPPRYLWAAIEGAAGLDLSGDEPSCNPRLAPEWRWLGVRDLRFRGGYVTWFVIRAPELTMYANFRFGHSLEYHAYDDDVTDALLSWANDDVTAIGLRREGEYVIFAGNTTERTVAASLHFKQRLEGRFQARTFSTLRSEWIDGGTLDGEELFRGIPVHIDRGGFYVLELRKQAE